MIWYGSSCFPFSRCQGLRRRPHSQPLCTYLLWKRICGNGMSFQSLSDYDHWCNANPDCIQQITGILFQLPSGLGSGGLLSYASEQADGSSDSYLSGFRTALKLVSVAIGLTIGLGLSLVLVHPVQSRKREAGIFSL